MKVYVDKIPKYCLDCVCCDLDLEECKIDKKIELCQAYFNSFEKKKPTKCPLQSLADYTKQVRKEVVQEIRGNSSLEFYEEFDGFSYHSGTKYIIKDSDLEKIQNSD